MARLKRIALEAGRTVAALALIPAWILLFLFLRPKDGDQ